MTFILTGMALMNKLVTWKVPSFHASLMWWCTKKKFCRLNLYKSTGSIYTMEFVFFYKYNINKSEIRPTYIASQTILKFPNGNALNILKDKNHYPGTNIKLLGLSLTWFFYLLAKRLRCHAYWLKNIITSTVPINLTKQNNLFLYYCFADILWSFTEKILLEPLILIIISLIYIFLN